MVKLRDLLKEEDTTLYQALENSWEIARSEWIPTLNMESDSHAGLPHLLNVEEWMDRIAESCRDIWSQHSKLPFGFNAVELYMALCAVLFHDIGRGRPPREDDKQHGTVSKEILNSSWAQLGIYSGRIAYELGHIVEFHTAKSPWSHHDVTKIHPWGTVHLEAIASLLTLADELDTAYTRAAPHYMKDPELLLEDKQKISLGDMDGYFTKGLMREFVSDLDLDPGSHLIKTVLFSDRLPDQPGGTCAEEWRRRLSAEKVTPNFRPEDYFFSYLESLRKNIDSEILDFLAHQYQKSDQYHLYNLTQNLRFPKSYPYRANMLYLLQLGDRQMPGLETESRAKTRTEVERLRHTADLIEETIGNVKRRTERSGVQIAIANPDHFIDLFRRVGGFLCYTVVRETLSTNEPRMSPDKFTDVMGELPAGDWAACWEQLDPGPEQSEGQLTEEQPGRSANLYTDFAEALKSATDALERTTRTVREIRKDAEETIQIINVARQSRLSATRAHLLLLKLFRCLLHVDLVPDPAEEDSAEEKVKPRLWDSWSIAQFNRNVLLAFHVYLANARRLWQWESELDYRFLGGGSIEARYWLSQEQPEPISDYLTFRQPRAEDADSGDEVPPISFDGYLTETMRQLRTHIKSLRLHGGSQQMEATDFQYAVRLIFMQWLLNDVRGKNKTLLRIRSGLEKLEIPFKEWLVEYNNHLFDSEWNLALEPSLNLMDVTGLCTAAVDLRSSLLREQHIPWETLAAALREPKMERVKTCASRLSSLVRIYSFRPEASNDSAEWLHYGHLLLAEWARKSKEPGGASPQWLLETSYSAWRFSFPKEPRDVEQLVKWLGRLRPSGKE